MKNILFYIAAFCLLSQALGIDRKLDETLLVDKSGLTVIQGTNPVSFKCGTEWAVAFTNDGQTAVLSTINGHWTLTGLTAAVAVAAIGEGTSLVSAIAGSVGVAQNNLQDVTSRTIALATTLAQNIGSPTFDAALTAAVATANTVLDDNGIQATDFNDDIMAAISLLGPSGGVINASDTTVQDVHDNASKTIGTIMNALASSGAMATVPSVAAAAGGNTTAAAAAAAAAGAGGNAAAELAAAGGNAAALAAAAGGNAAALAAAAAAAGK